MTSQKSVTTTAGSAAGSRTSAASHGSSTSITNNALSSGSNVLPALSGTLFADPNGDIAQSALSFAAANPSYESLLGRLAATPSAAWFVGASNDQQASDNYVTAATTAGQIPVLVAYNIPTRDCGGDSAGGASSDSAYQAWAQGLVAGIGNRAAIVIVEPDALANMDCLSSSQQQARLSDIGYLIHLLKTETKARTYIDAGNPTWQSVATMAARLSDADVAEANGFSLNVSNFETTSSNISYGDKISSLIGGKHFVIDTSRNGNGPTTDDQWCNPAGRAVGQAPTLQTGTTFVDGFLWVKGVGGSDGACGPSEAGTTAPAAGVWWPSYALALLQAAGWN
jgi:endoglucanase